MRWILWYPAAFAHFSCSCEKNIEIAAHLTKLLQTGVGSVFFLVYRVHNARRRLKKINKRLFSAFHDVNLIKSECRWWKKLFSCIDTRNSLLNTTALISGVESVIWVDSSVEIATSPYSLYLISSWLLSAWMSHTMRVVAAEAILMLHLCYVTVVVRCVISISEVTLRLVRLVLRWATLSICNQSPRPT